MYNCSCVTVKLRGVATVHMDRNQSREHGWWKKGFVIGRDHGGMPRPGVSSGNVQVTDLQSAYYSSRLLSPRSLIRHILLFSSLYTSIHMSPLSAHQRSTRQINRGGVSRRRAVQRVVKECGYSKSTIYVHSHTPRTKEHQQQARQSKQPTNQPTN